MVVPAGPAAGPARLATIYPARHRLEQVRPLDALPDISAPSGRPAEIGDMRRDGNHSFVRIVRRLLSRLEREPNFGG
jgi:hypothetical protein